MQEDGKLRKLAVGRLALACFKSRRGDDLDATSTPAPIAMRGGASEPPINRDRSPPRASARLERCLARAVLEP